MSRMLIAFIVLLFSGAALAQTEVELYRDAPPESSVFQLESFADGFDRPLYLTHAGDGSGRVFVVTQSGTITALSAEGERLGTFLDVSDLLTGSVFGGGYTERGLLGLAFHPDYAENGTFFINYTDNAGSTVVARYTVSADDPNAADPDSATIIFTQTQPFPNHNGGHMAFGPDGYLYISLGDGGAAGDPLAAGQNPNMLLGSILRIDVNSEDGYTIPEDNPFVDGGGAPEVWAYGVRNVWRFSFDRATGDMYLGDVGQNQWEEINFQPADSPGGENYGWSAYEATHVYNESVSAPDAIMPIAEYDHSQGCSVTGGYVYRGDAIPELTATYLYSDYCTGLVWYAYRSDATTWHSEMLRNAGFQVSSFGEDESGELYIIDYTGTVYKIVAGNADA